MKSRLAIIWFAALAMCLFALPALAGFIELSVSVTPVPTDHGLKLEIGLSNQGDEAAEDISLEAFLPGTETAKILPGPGILKPGAKRKITAALKRREKAKGLHPVILRVRYRDANRYPFSTLAYGLYQVGKPLSPQVLLRGIPSIVDESGRASFALANLSSDPLAVDILFFAPDELKLSDRSLKTRIAAMDKDIIETDLENRTALAGSSYPVVALARYEWKGQKLTSPASAPVSVRTVKEAPSAWWVWAAILGFLAGVTLWLGLRRKSR